MTKRSRNTHVGAAQGKRDIPAEYAEEVNIVPSPTAVAAEALATGVVPLESVHRHSDDSQIPGDDDLLRVGDPDTSVTDNAFVGDETFAGDMPTPDQNQVDDIGRAMGVQEEDSGALRTSSEILDARDQRRAPWRRRRILAAAPGSPSAAELEPLSRPPRSKLHSAARTTPHRRPASRRLRPARDGGRHRAPLHLQPRLPAAPAATTSR